MSTSTFQNVNDLHAKVEYVRRQQLKAIADARSYLCMMIADASFLSDDERRDRPLARLQEPNSR